MIAVGEIVTLSYTITNTGEATLSDATINDPLLDAPLLCGSGDLPVDDSVTCEATYVLTQADLDAGTLTSAATATALDPQGDRVTDVATTTVDLPLPEPEPEPVPVPALGSIALMLLTLLMLLMGLLVCQQRRCTA